MLGVHKILKVNAIYIERDGCPGRDYMFLFPFSSSDDSTSFSTRYILSSSVNYLFNSSHAHYVAIQHFLLGRTFWDFIII